jgi:hypothetical protein
MNLLKNSYDVRLITIEVHTRADFYAHILVSQLGFVEFCHS